MSSWHRDYSACTLRRSSQLYSGLLPSWQVCIHFRGASSPCSTKPFIREPSSRLGEGAVGMLGRVSPPTSSFLWKDSQCSLSLPLRQTWKHFTQFACWVPSWRSHSGTATWARIPENGGQHLPRAWAPQRCTVPWLWTTTHPSVPSRTALLQLSFSPQRAASPRKITKVPETHRGTFRVSYKASWDCPAVNWPLKFQTVSWDHWGVSTEQKDNNMSLWLEKSKAKQSNVISGWSFVHLRVSLFVVFYFFFSLLVLKCRHIDRCFPYISILWYIKSCCWSSYKSFQGIISFIVTPGSSGNLRGENNILHWLCD